MSNIYDNYLHEDNWMTEDEVDQYSAEEEFAKTCIHESTTWKNCREYCMHCGASL